MSKQGVGKGPGKMASLSSVYIYNISSRVTSLAAAVAEPTTEEIQEQHMKHIGEISKHLATEPIQSEDLTFEQEQWLNFRMSRPFPKPYRPWPKTKKKFEFKTFSFAEVLASVEPLEETD